MCQLICVITGAKARCVQIFFRQAFIVNEYVFNHIEFIRRVRDHSVPCKELYGFHKGK